MLITFGLIIAFGLGTLLGVGMTRSPNSSTTVCYICRGIQDNQVISKNIALVERLEQQVKLKELELRLAQLSSPNETVKMGTV